MKSRGEGEWIHQEELWKGGEMEIKIRDKLTLNSNYPTIKCVFLPLTAVWSASAFRETHSMGHKDKKGGKFIFSSSLSLFLPIYCTWFKKTKNKQTPSSLHDCTGGKARTSETWELAPEKPNQNVHYPVDNVHVWPFNLPGLILWCCYKAWGRDGCSVSMQQWCVFVQK